MNPVVAIRGHSFLANALGDRPRVLDLGANHGMFARTMIDQFKADVRMVEANPKLHAELTNSGICPCFHYAVVGRDMETVRFNIARNDEGSSVLNLPAESAYLCTLTETVEVPARTVPRLLQEIGWDHVDLMKMDIEGAEVEILDSLSEQVLGQISQISVEFHGAAVFGFGLAHKVEQCLQRLAEIGFQIKDFTSPARIDVLLVNPKLFPPP